MHRALIEKYAQDAAAPAEAIAGLSRTELNAFPVPGTWSIQQIVVHLMDSDLIASDRMKRIAAEQRPTLIGYDEAAWAKNLPQAELDPGQVCEVFRLNRLLTAEILRRLPDAAFERVGLHNERGVTTLAEMVNIYCGHVDHHLKFVRQKRQLLGKP